MLFVCLVNSGCEQPETGQPYDFGAPQFPPTLIFIQIVYVIQDEKFIRFKTYFQVVFVSDKLPVLNHLCRFGQFVSFLRNLSFGGNNANVRKNDSYQESRRLGKRFSLYHLVYGFGSIKTRYASNICERLTVKFVLACEWRNTPTNFWQNRVPVTFYKVVKKTGAH